MDYNLGIFRPRARNEYSSQERYKYLDIVSYLGGSYMMMNFDTIDGDGAIGIAPTGSPESELYWMPLGVKGDKGDLADQYQPFLIIEDGQWDYSAGDKIFIPDTALPSLNIINAYDGCCGLIITRKDIELPGNSLKKIDYNYITLNTETGYYLYTFTYANLGSAEYKFIFSRGIIDG